MPARVRHVGLYFVHGGEGRCIRGDVDEFCGAGQANLERPTTDDRFGAEPFEMHSGGSDVVECGVDVGEESVRSAEMDRCAGTGVCEQLGGRTDVLRSGVSRVVR